MSALADDARVATRGGASLLVLQTLGRLLGLGFVVVVTRILEPDQFGRYSVVAAVVVFGTFLADFGTTPAMTRLVARDPTTADQLLSGTLLLSLGFGLVVYAGTMVFALAADYPRLVVVDILVGACAIPMASMLSSILGVLDGVGLIARRSLVTFLQTAVVAVGGTVLIATGAGVRAAIAALAISPGVGLAVGTAIARRAGVWRSWPRLDRVSSGRLLRAAVPFAVIGGLTALTLRFDVILLSLLRSSAQTASYDLALRLLESLAYLSAAICSPSLFLLARRLSQGDHEGARRAYQEAGRALYLIGLPVSIVLGVLGRDIVSIAVSQDFASVARPFAIMGGAQWLLFIVYLQGSLVLAGDALGKGAAVAGLNALVTVALDMILVPAFGPTGAAVAMVGSWAFTIVTFDRFHRRTTALRTPLPAVGMLVSSAALAGTLLALRPVSVLLAGLVGPIIYVGGLIVTRSLLPSDLSRLRSAFTGGSRPLTN